RLFSAYGGERNEGPPAIPAEAQFARPARTADAAGSARLIARARPVDLCGQYVAFPPDGLNQAGRFHVWRQFAAQAADEGVYAPVEPLPLVLAGQLHDGVPGEHAVGA